MGVLLSVALGGVLGALTRYGISTMIASIYIIAAINIMGSFFMGLAFAWFEYSNTLSDEWRLFVTVGLLGSFTTFSTFSMHIFQLFNQGALGEMMLYLMVSVMGAIIAFIFGFWIIKQVLT